MTSTPRRVFLHIGLHKTGTTYLQNILRANRARLADQGVLYPGGEGQPAQVFAVWDLLGRRPRGSTDARISGAWAATVDVINGSDQPAVLLSDEHLSLATLRQARTAVAAFDGAEVHVVVTARDLARVLVSAWQEEVKNRGAWTWSQFAGAVRDPEVAARNPARGFWVRQDLPAILETWQAAVPTERIHVVTVPPAGAPPELLLERFASVVGFDPSLLTEEAPWTNETVGLAGTEALRRLNERLDQGLNQRQYDRAVKLTIVRILAERTTPIRFAVPPEDFGWVLRRGKEMAEAVRQGGFPVVGDLAELEPIRSDGRAPDDVTDAELLDVTLTALAGLAERYATVWWARKPADEEQPVDSVTAKAASNARAATFRGKQAAAQLADRSPVAAKALGAYLHGRAVVRRRAARG